MDLTEYSKAGYSLLYVETFEIKRAMQNLTVQEPFQIYKWNMIEGLVNVEEGEKYTDFTELFTMAENLEKCIFLMENLDMFFNSESLIQMILNSMVKFKQNQVMLVIVGAGGNVNQPGMGNLMSEGSSNIPAPLEKVLTKVEFSLPSKEEFREIAKELCEQVEVEFKEEIANLCMGLSLEEGENALSRSIIIHKKLDKNAILEMKRSSIKSTGFMDFMEPEPLTSLGGLNKWKQFVGARRKAWEPKFENLPKLRAILLVGIQGCGKTLSAKVLASIFNWPCIILDVNALKGSFQGETERRTRMATRVIDAFGQCIVVVDEISLAFGGANLPGGGNFMNPADAGMMGTWLTWMQESKGEKIIIATTNDLNLPPAFLRAERWDAIFFVDFPNFDERKEIIKIQNKKWGADLPDTEEFIELIEGWTGAEISQLAKDSLFEPWEDAMYGISLIKDLKPTEIKEIQKFGKTVRRASASESSGIAHKMKRKISTEEKGEDDLTDLKAKIGRKFLQRKS